MKFRELVMISVIGLGYLVESCVKSQDFETPEVACVQELPAIINYSQMKGFYQGKTVQIQEDVAIMGYVTSSDASGNFYSVLHLQNHPINPSDGIQIQLDLRDTYLFYPPGTKIYIKLKGLFIGKSKEGFKLGSSFTSFGNLNVGRLPALAVPLHVLRDCAAPVVLLPRKLIIDQLDTTALNTLVQLQGIEVIEEEDSLSFANAKEETVRTLQDCNGDKIGMVNSGYSDFFDHPLPKGNGELTGVVLRNENTLLVAIRNLDDLALLQERCEDNVNQVTSDSLFITELADPENNTGARFLELYNNGKQSLNLEGWSLQRYTNANNFVGSVINLSGQVIPGKSTLIVASDIEEFMSVYGFAPELGAASNSAAGSNGDDTIQLLDPFGTVIDIFGRIGEDGSGTDHDFEDGRALRKATVGTGNPNYNVDEWIVYNKSGTAGTINQPQQAPQDFTPGFRN